MGNWGSKQEKKGGKKTAAAVRAQAQISDEDRALLDIKAQRDQLLAQRRRLDTQVAKDGEAIKRLVAAGQKQRAVLALKLKKNREQLSLDTEGHLRRLEVLVESVEFARVQRDTVEALAAGVATLKQIQKQIGGVDQVERLLGEHEDALEAQREINALLAGTASVEDAEALAELARYEEEARLPALPAAVAPAAGSPVPQRPAATDAEAVPAEAVPAPAAVPPAAAEQEAEAEAEAAPASSLAVAVAEPERLPGTTSTAPKEAEPPEAPPVAAALEEIMAEPVEQPAASSATPKEAEPTEAPHVLGASEEDIQGEPAAEAQPTAAPAAPASPAPAAAPAKAQAAPIPARRRELVAA